MALSCFGTRETYQFLMLGPHNAGKTTLLYKLKLGDNWKKQEIIRDMKSIKDKEDSGAGCHYEEFRGKGMTYGIWDLPGKKAARTLWPIFYRFLQIDAVLLCLDKMVLLDQSAEALETCEELKKLIAFMVHEPELRSAAFAILLNEKDNVKELEDLSDRDCREILGLHELQLVSEDRIMIFTLNTADVNESSGVWPKILEFFKRQILAASKD
ncbi:unnamed protein product [Amoebophrya sp. A120]|nr:unnamed protein product [Amoebophrya sp. A120]|eukprot:GSA120T00017400001.1